MTVDAWLRGAIACLLACVWGISEAADVAMTTGEFPYIPGLALAASQPERWAISLGTVAYPAGLATTVLKKPGAVAGQIAEPVVFVGKAPAITFDVWKEVSPAWMPLQGYGWDAIPAPREGATVLSITDAASRLWIYPDSLVPWEQPVGLAYVLPSDVEAMTDALLGIAEQAQSPELEATVVVAFAEGGSSIKRSLVCDLVAHRPQAWAGLSVPAWRKLLTWGTAIERPYRLRLVILTQLSQHWEQVPVAVAKAVSELAPDRFVVARDHGLIRYLWARLQEQMLRQHGKTLTPAEISRISLLFGRTGMAVSGNADLEKVNADGSLVFYYDDQKAMQKQIEAVLFAAHQAAEGR